MTPKFGSDARSEVFLRVFVSWMLTVFGLAVSVVALGLIAFSGWGKPGSVAQTVAALAVGHLLVGLTAIAAGIIVSSVLRERARLVALIVLGAVGLSAAAFIVAAWIVSAA